MQKLQRITITEDGVTDDYYRASEVDIAISESITDLEELLNFFANGRISVFEMGPYIVDKDEIKEKSKKWINRIYGLLKAINTLGYKVTFDCTKSSLPEDIQELAGRPLLIATYGYNFKIVREENTQK